MERNLYNSSVYSQSSNYLLIVAFIIYLINPLLGIFLLAISLSLSNGGRKPNTIYLYLAISIFFALLNTTRTPESDLLGYKIIFESASNVSLGQYLSGVQKEIIYYIFTFILNRLLLSNFLAYIIVVTMLQYMLKFMALEKIIGKDNRVFLVFGSLLILLDGASFWGSIHLLRQYTACSIFMYFFAERFVNHKTLWILIPIAVLIHSSSGVVFVIALIPGLQNRINPRLMITITILLIILLTFGDRIIAILDYATRSVSWLNYPFERIASMGELDYGWYTGTGVLGVRKNILRYTILPIIIYYYLLGKKPGAHYLINFCLLYFLVLEMFVANHLLYMQMRMAGYIVPFSAFALTLMVKSIYEHSSLSISFPVAIMILAFMAYRFSKGYLYTNFAILDFMSMLYTPLISYIIGFT
jgi:hypothetical protein